MSQKQRPAGVHPLDWRAQQLYERVQARVGSMQKALTGPAPLGKRKITVSQWARQLTKLTQGQTAEMLATMPARTPLMSTALDQLGGHGLALLPYLQPPGSPMPPENEGMI